ncbi:MAG: TonB-dependent receptor [Bacteroidales bacterium]
MKRKLMLIFLLSLGISSIVHAQAQKGHYSIRGFVYEHETKAPIEMAFVTLPDLNLWGTTDSKGKFIINRVLPGTTKIEISCLGYQTVSMDIIIERDIDSLVFRLREENLKLESVTVTATESKSALTTTTRMDRQAIDHLQVINPTDIMSLLPGGKTANPNLMTESIFSLRGGDGNGAFGTAVEVDGIRLSSNSVLSSVKGIDTRNLSASNFESIEVITGVPSVEYGDMTAGMVVIKTKKGRSPYSASVSLNPTTKQVSLSKGFDLQKDRGVLNINAEYAHAFSNPVSRYTTYFRNGYGVSYSNTFNRDKRPLRLNVNLGGSIGRQEAKNDPDVYRNIYSSTADNALRFGVNANWLVNSNYITSLDFGISASYKDDYAEQNDYFSYATTRPAINVMENGYFETNYLPAQFYNLQTIDSKSLNFNANIKATLNKKWGSVTNRMKAGMGWSSNGNVGKGEDYQDDIYPDGFRPRPYTDIPFMHNINGYLENNATIPIGKTTLSLIAGVRVESNIIKDMAYNSAISASPRFNGRYTLVDNNKNSAFLRKFSVRGAWGMMEKLPSFSILYPMDKYRDIIVYSKNYGTQNDYFNVAKTNVFRDFFNPDLEWSRSRNIELGMDANIKGISISVVYYNNKAKNPYITENFHEPYTYSKSDENFPVPANPEFRVDKLTGDIFVKDLDDPSAGEVLIPKSVNDTIFIQNSMQSNGEPSVRQGVELSVDFGKIESIRTSFRLDARYSHTKDVDERLHSSYSRRPHSTLPTNLGRSYEFAAFYLGGTSDNITYNGSWSDGMSMNFTATTHIPEIRMTVSLRLEGTLYSQSQKLTYYNGEEWAFLVDENGNKLSRSVYDQKEYFSGVWPVAYMGFDQKIHPFTSVEAEDPRFASLIGQSNNVYNYTRDGNGPYFMANLSLTKEIGDLASISFYVNNFTKSNPYIKSWATGIETARNIGFAYGATLRIKF